MPPIGVVAVASYLPDATRSAEEIARLTGGRWTVEGVREKLGIERIHIPGRDDGVQEMGAKAAERCLERAGVPAADVDCILCIGDELREYPMTTSGIYIQERIGARNAWAADVMQKCSSFAAGARLGRALLRSEPNLRNVLLCGGYRNGDLIDYTNPRVSFMYNLSAGGGAALLARGHDRNEVLCTSIITDGALSRHVLARYGGTAAPITPENVDAARRCLDVTDQESMRVLLAERSHANFLRVIDQALAESGCTRRDIGYLAILHMKRSGHDAILHDLGLRPEQSTYLSATGHIGQFDQVLSLEIAASEGRLRDGQVVVAVGAGIGFSWGATILRWGPRPVPRHAGMGFRSTFSVEMGYGK